jgi:hypothetical protein
MPPILMRSRVQVGSMAKERGEDGDGGGAAFLISSDVIW